MSTASYFKDKVIAITGAGSGIGLQLAKQLAAQGATLSLCDINGAALDDAVNAITSAGGRAHGTTVDVSDRAAVEAWITQTVAELGPLDGAANMAGIIGRHINVRLLSEIDDEDFDRVMAVNVKGVLNCLRAELPVVKDGGAIVNASSLAGVMGFQRNAAYVASKHAVVGLTKAAARELGVEGRRVRCNCFCAGPVDTPMLGDWSQIAEQEFDMRHTALGRVARAEEIANVAEFLLSDKSSYITGTAQIVDGGWLC